MEGYGGPAQPSPTIAQCLNGGYGWLEIECHRCETQASIALEHVRRPRDTPIWKLESAFRCRSCGTKRYNWLLRRVPTLRFLYKVSYASAQPRPTRRASRATVLRSVPVRRARATPSERAAIISICFSRDRKLKLVLHHVKGTASARLWQISLAGRIFARSSFASGSSQGG
jgi:hypothetical protein